MSNAKQAMSRRELLCGGAAIASAIPLSLLSESALAVSAAAMHYADASPNPATVCANCISFIPGATPDAMGKCYIVTRGVDAINPKGHCDGWSAKK